METGNWVSRDLYNGRIVRIPNSTVLKGSVFNYSHGFRFIWDEIKVLLSATSDCKLAREMLLRVAKEAIGEYLLEAQASWKVISDNYRSANPPLQPTVALVVNNGSLEFTVSYVVDYTKRTAMQDQLFTRIVEEIANCTSLLQWALPVSTVTNQHGSPYAIDEHASSLPHGADHAAEPAKIPPPALDTLAGDQGPVLP
jgi:small-conductance mechanosensitive channel